MSWHNPPSKHQVDPTWSSPIRSGSGSRKQDKEVPSPRGKVCLLRHRVVGLGNHLSMSLLIEATLVLVTPSVSTLDGRCAGVLHCHTWDTSQSHASWYRRCSSPLAVIPTGATRLGVTICDDVQFFFSFYLFIYHVYCYSQSYDWRPFSSHMTHLESSFISHVIHRPMTHVDSCWLIVTHWCFTLLFIAFPIVRDSYKDTYCSCYLLFPWRSLSFGNVYCS